MQLTVSSLNGNKIKAVRVLCRTFNVPRTMLRDRRDGAPVHTLYGRCLQPEASLVKEGEDSQQIALAAELYDTAT
jgi:hypothetical protein